jgi:hypothetical protein
MAKARSNAASFAVLSAPIAYLPPRSGSPGDTSVHLLASYSTVGGQRGLWGPTPPTGSYLMRPPSVRRVCLVALATCQPERLGYTPRIGGIGFPEMLQLPVDDASRHTLHGRRHIAAQALPFVRR